jgi:hypothetical protein
MHVNPQHDKVQTAALELMDQGYAHKTIEAKIIDGYQRGIFAYSLSLNNIRYLSYREGSTIRVTNYRRGLTPYAEHKIGLTIRRRSRDPRVVRSIREQE